MPQSQQNPFSLTQSANKHFKQSTYHESSGNSPPNSNTSLRCISTSPKFGKSPIGSTATQQFFSDALGVWVPKLPLLRSKTQFFEETFLEFVEDAAFYFTIPLSAFGLTRLLQSKRLQSILLPPGGDYTNLVDKLGESVSTNSTPQLLATRMGVLVSAVSIAAGFEYMVQHAKNVITANVLKTKNFAAVAGLEAPQQQAVNGEEDPVAKAKRRLIQVAALTVAGIFTGLALPRLLMKSPTALKKAEALSKWIYWGNNFDLSKPLLMLLTLVAGVSYLDAARDSLERKETGTRWVVSFLYMLFGKEVIGYALGKASHKFGKVDYEDNGTLHKHSISEVQNKYHFSFLKKNGDGTEINPLKQALKPETFLNMEVLEKNLSSQFDRISKLENIPKMSEALKEALAKRHAYLGVASYLISAAICGIGINVITYRQTRERFNKQRVGTAFVPAVYSKLPIPVSYQGRLPQPIPL